MSEPTKIDLIIMAMVAAAMIVFGLWEGVFS
jgi:hypothetical protein